MDELLDNVSTVQDLGQQFAQQLFEVEVRYVIDKEWAQTVEDVLTRRTKHRLHMSESQVADFQRWYISNYGSTMAV